MDEGYDWEYGGCGYDLVQSESIDSFPNSSPDLVQGLGRVQTLKMNQRVGVEPESDPHGLHVMAHGLAYGGFQNPYPLRSLSLGETPDETLDGLECIKVQAW